MKSNLDRVFDDISQSDTVVTDKNRAAIEQSLSSKSPLSVSFVIKLAMILGGMLAATFFLIFLFFASNFPIKGAGILGLIALVGSIITTQKKQSEYTDAISICLYLMGLIMIGISSTDNRQLTDILLTISFSSLIVAVFSRRMVLSGLALFIALNAFYFYLSKGSDYSAWINGFYFLFASIFIGVWMLWEAKIIAHSQYLKRRYGTIRCSVLCFYLGLFYYVNSSSVWFGYYYSLGHSSISLKYKILSSIGAVVIINLIFYCHLRSIKSAYTALILFATVIASGLGLCFLSSSIIAALMVLVLSFYVNYRLGVVLGIVTLLGALSNYYYLLNITLLNKSYILMGAGVTFLAGYYFISKIAGESHNE